MIVTGLASVTFRKIDPEQILELTIEAGLEAIEWGGDIHVPHGEVGRAQQVRKMTLDSGLKIASYGSYYKSLSNDHRNPCFRSVLETAIALGAPGIRVWAGTESSDDADIDYRTAIANDLREIGEIAQTNGVSINLEYHGNTLTDSNESATALIREINLPNVKLMWQPRYWEPTEHPVDDLQFILPYLGNIHVFHWNLRGTEIVRHPLLKGKDMWRQCMAKVSKLNGNHYALLEFVRNNSPDQFLNDAKTLKRLIKCKNLEE